MSRDSSASDCSSWPFSRATAAWFASVSRRRRSSSLKRRALGQPVGDDQRADQPGLAAQRAHHRLADRRVAGGRAGSWRNGPPLGATRWWSGSVRGVVHGDHDSAARRRGATSSAAPRRRGDARVQDDLGELGPEHLAGVARAGRRAPSRARASAGGCGWTGRAARAARASRAPRRTPGRRGTRSTSGRISRSQSRVGSSHRIETASSARLVLAMATRPPNWIISGSFSNCGAPPEIVMTVAIVTALSTVATRVAANAAIQSGRCGAPPSASTQRGRRRHPDGRDEHEVRQVERDLDRRLAGTDASADRGPDEHGDEVVVRARAGRSPITAGNSLSENECVSRRKWTSTTFSSAAKKPPAITTTARRSGGGTGAARGGSRR